MARWASSKFGIQAQSFAPFAHGAIQIPLLLEGDTQSVMSLDVVGGLLDHGLQRLCGVADVTGVDLHLASVNQGVVVFGVGLQDFIVQAAGLIVALCLKKKLDIFLFHLPGLSAVPTRVRGIRLRICPGRRSRNRSY